MTTREAEELYKAEHKYKTSYMKIAIFNPHKKLLTELPVIYGFPNGGASQWYEGGILSEDGDILGGHFCSDEIYMPHDLGILDGTRPDRHEAFRKYYPDGYRMEFVSKKDIPSHPEFNAAVERFKLKHMAENENNNKAEL